MAKPTSLQPRPSGYKPKQDYYVYNGQIYGVSNGNQYSGTESYKMPDGRIIQINTGGFQPYERVKGGLIRQDVVGPFTRMIEAAKADGIDLSPKKDTHMFRTYQQQQEKASSGSSSVAKPGNSAHGTGRAIDFNTADNFKVNADYSNNPQAAWLNANANNYGFYAPIEMYAKENTQEPWHYEYNPELDPAIKAQREQIGQQRLNVAMPAMNLASAIGSFNFAKIPQAVISANQPNYWNQLQNTNNEYQKEKQTEDDLSTLRSGKAKKIKSNTTT